jgi:hypothetical protein
VRREEQANQAKRDAVTSLIEVKCRVLTRIGPIEGTDAVRYLVCEEYIILSKIM